MKKFLRDTLGISKLAADANDIIENGIPGKYGVVMSPWFKWCCFWLYRDKTKASDEFVGRGLYIYSFNKINVYSSKRWLFRYEWIKRDKNGNLPKFS